ncbi:hypothetical protein H4S02_013562, partial [Coemansia sp. RSA 2611]
MLAHNAYGRMKYKGGHPGRPNHNNGSGGMPWGALLGAVAGAALNRPSGGSNYGGGGSGGYSQHQSYGRPNGGYPPYGRPNGGGHGFGSGPSGGSGDMVTN